MIMKNILLTSLIIVTLFSIAGFALADSDNIIINNNVYNGLVQTEYQCRILHADCVVDKMSYIQTGAIYYNAECNASFMEKTAYENDVIDDVKSGRFYYCSMTARTIKSN